MDWGVSPAPPGGRGAHAPALPPAGGSGHPHPPSAIVGSGGSRETAVCGLVSGARASRSPAAGEQAIPSPLLSLAGTEGGGGGVLARGRGRARRLPKPVLVFGAGVRPVEPLCRDRPSEIHRFIRSQRKSWGPHPRRVAWGSTSRLVPLHVKALLSRPTGPTSSSQPPAKGHAAGLPATS